MANVKKIALGTSTYDIVDDSAVHASIDSSPTSGSSNLVTSGGVNTALAAKQNKLTAGTGITISSNNVISATGGGGGGSTWYSIMGGDNPIGANIAHSFYSGGGNDTKYLTFSVLAPQSSIFSTLSGLTSYIRATGVVMLIDESISQIDMTWTRIGRTIGGTLLIIGELDSWFTAFADNDDSRNEYVLKISPGMVDTFTDSVSAWGGNLYKHHITIQFASPATYISRGGTHLHNGDYVIGYGKREFISW